MGPPFVVATELESAGAVLAILLGSAAAGMFVQRFLSDTHKSQDTRELSRTITSMLVTLAALVLGLLTNSVKDSFDHTGRNLRSYSVELIGLGDSLRDFGPEAMPALRLLRTYVASAIVSTWPSEPRPPSSEVITGVGAEAAPHPSLESSKLGAVLEQAAAEIRRLPARDSMHGTLAAAAAAQAEQLLNDRWTLIEDAQTSIPIVFYRVLMFWLTIVFASLGLITPRNVLALAMLVMGAMAIAAVVFAIMEMDTPFGGLITVSSSPMRDALAHLSE